MRKPCGEMHKEEIVITAVGDIMLGDHSMCNGFGVGSVVKKRGPKFIFCEVASALSGDIIFGNLESVLSDKNKNVFSVESTSLRGSPLSVEGLKFAGFNILSLANNHSLEHGYDALYDTMSTIKANNINYVGVGENLLDARKPLIIKLKGRKIAFLGYCLRPDKTSYISIKHKTDIISDIKTIKNGVDYVILSLHWGDEFIQIPARWQIDFAHDLVDCGTSVILGHHPHVLQGIEEYNGGIIAYSLGNFIFDMWHENEKTGGILKIFLGDTIHYNFIKTYINNTLQPTITNDSRIPNIFSVDDHIYTNLLKHVQKTYKKDYKRYFIQNIFRYNKLILPSLVLNSLKLKLK